MNSPFFTLTPLKCVTFISNSSGSKIEHNINSVIVQGIGIEIMIGIMYFLFNYLARKESFQSESTSIINSPRLPPSLYIVN